MHLWPRTPAAPSVLALFQSAQLSLPIQKDTRKSWLAYVAAGNGTSGHTKLDRMEKLRQAMVTFCAPGVKIRHSILYPQFPAGRVKYLFVKHPHRQPEIHAHVIWDLRNGRSEHATSDLPLHMITVLYRPPA